jgi:4,5-dihydroxyphthalate decarboxylase
MTVELSLAITDYDHVRDVTSGRVPVEGVHLNAVELTVDEIFNRFTALREWDASELSFSRYLSLLSRGAELTAIPVFPSRVFRHSSLYVRTDSDARHPRDLAGARIGVPEWVHTAGVYTRGILAHEYGLDLGSVSWVQAGINEPGRRDAVSFDLPDGFAYRPMPDRSLAELLASGEIDAVISERAPGSPADPVARPLFDDVRAVELEFYQRTRIFPILHVIALRRDTYEANRWLARNLLSAFTTAFHRATVRATNPAASRLPLPWIDDYATRMYAALGEDFRWYGANANAATLDALLTYVHEQGITARPLRLDEIFAAETYV